MADFPRTVTPVSVSELELPGPLISKSQSGRIVTRGTQAIGRTWKETYLLNVQDTTHKAFLAAVRNLWRNGTSFEISHVDYLVPKGTIGGSPLINIASQLVTQPENYGHADWVKAGTPVLTSGQADPYGGTSAYLFNDDDGAVRENMTSVVAFTGNATKALAIFLRQGTQANNAFGIYDNTAGTWRHRIDVTWTGGVPSLATGLGSGTLFPVEKLDAAWWRLSASANSVVAANSNLFFLCATPDDGGAATGTVYIFGANAWNASVPMPYRSTTGTPVLTGSQLPLDGATASVSNWLRAGDLLSVAVGSTIGVYEATSAVNSQSDGGVYVPINPPIFSGGSPADNAAVTVTGVKMRACILEPPVMPDTSGLGANYGELTLSLSENLGT